VEPRDCPASQEDGGVFVFLGQSANGQIDRPAREVTVTRQAEALERNDDAGETYDSWLAGVPKEITLERVWQLYAYRKALYLYDLCWSDCEKLVGNPLGKAAASQLIRSAGSITANIEEGYGRGYGKERDYFLRVALGSARESKGWYYPAKGLLTPKVLADRLHLLSEVVALLVTELRRSRNRR